MTYGGKLYEISVWGSLSSSLPFLCEFDGMARGSLRTTCQVETVSDVGGKYALILDMFFSVWR